MSSGDAEDLRDHVFVSYVSEDSDRGDFLRSALERAGLTIWRDTRDLHLGDDWEAGIREAAITRSLTFIACFSEKSAAT